jgi:predicted AAA+ superfamily ATPase
MLKIMLKRKISSYIENHLSGSSDKILIIEGARQIGKSYIIREVGTKLFTNFVEINFVEDDEGAQLFKNIRRTDDFYLKLSAIAGNSLDEYSNTLIFLDEIQHYPQYLTMLKFLRQEHRYQFIASGSLLGITLRNTTSIPIGSILRKEMFQLDFEEFLWANGVGSAAIDVWQKNYTERESLDETTHQFVLDLFKKYLLVGGMPDAVNTYLETHNIMRVREVQESIRSLYADDASKYEQDSNKTLLIRKIYEMIPSQMENKKKRIVAKDIQGLKGDRFSRYTNEFEYMLSSGIANGVSAVSNPKFPLAESAQKNLIKLYLNDVGILTSQLYQYNLQPILSDERSINLGSVYESVVAQELKAHGFKLFYYDNRHKGEVDFIVDDFQNQSILPLEIKSGRDYTIHSALNNFMQTSDYNVHSAYVLSNERMVQENKGVVYLPIYYLMFIKPCEATNLIF